MSRRIGVADAKRDFSELMNRVVLKGERFVIERRGKQVAALVRVEDLEGFEPPSEGKPLRGLLAAVGAWENYPGLDRFVRGLYLSREKAKDLKVGGLR